ncbi:hypothetical protein BD413DRAFT_491431 [Trametes elegans]|nr:hypothetical protein BD413DRAFT_491431 [Trametes elegans]
MASVTSGSNSSGTSNVSVWSLKRSCTRESDLGNPMDVDRPRHAWLVQYEDKMARSRACGTQPWFNHRFAWVLVHHHEGSWVLLQACPGQREFRPVPLGYARQRVAEPDAAPAAARQQAYASEFERSGTSLNTLTLEHISDTLARLVGDRLVSLVISMCWPELVVPHIPETVHVLVRRLPKLQLLGIEDVQCDFFQGKSGVSLDQYHAYGIQKALEDYLYTKHPPIEADGPDRIPNVHRRKKDAENMVRLMHQEFLDLHLAYVHLDGGLTDLHTDVDGLFPRLHPNTVLHIDPESLGGERCDSYSSEFSSSGYRNQPLEYCSEKVM